MPLILRAARMADEPALRALHAQLATEHFEVLAGADRPFAEILAQIAHEAAASDAPRELLVAEKGGVIVGRVSIRRALSAAQLAIGGHVGYAVAPEHRLQGHAHEMLELCVDRLWELGIDEVLLTCDDDNGASAAVIEGCGGVLEDVVDFGGPVPTRRYWIGAAAL